MRTKTKKWPDCSEACGSCAGWPARHCRSRLCCWFCWGPQRWPPTRIPIADPPDWPWSQSCATRRALPRSDYESENKMSRAICPPNVGLPSGLDYVKLPSFVKSSLYINSMPGFGTKRTLHIFHLLMMVIHLRVIVIETRFWHKQALSPLLLVKMRCPSAHLTFHRC